jgi:hypothetical protein
MKEINDGGPAFPVPMVRYEDNFFNVTDGGMSLRDWFAGQALAGIGASDLKHSYIWQRFSDEAISLDGISELCYMLADAMLKEKDTIRE